MGASPGLSQAIKDSISSPAYQGNADAQLAHLTKLVHILWKEVEKLENIISVIPEGLRIKAGMSEILVLRNGGIRLDGQRILLKTPGKDQMFF
jgi:hypothetical protein